MSAPRSLRQQFGQDFAGSAFQAIDGEPRMVGKFGQIAQFEDGTFDVWFVGSGLKPLSGRRLTEIAKSFPQEAGLTRLTGEAHTQGRGRNFVLRSAILAGVKKKRRVSAATREKLREQLAQARAAA